MAGLFDHMNHPGTVENQRTMNAGATTEAKASRLSLASDIWSIYEQAQPNGSPWLTEAEARTAFTTAGVVFS